MCVDNCACDFFFIFYLSSLVTYWKVPFEQLFKVKVSYDSLRVFGFLYYGKFLLRKQDKFSKQTRKFVFIGYSSGQKRLRLYNLEIHRVFISNDVHFREESFPFYPLQET